MRKHFITHAVAFSLLAALTACRSDNNDPDRDPSVPPPPEGIKVQMIQDKQVRLLTPAVDFGGGVMNITGLVRRRPGVHGVIAGRVDIDVVDSDNNNLDWIPALLYPSPMPSEGKGESGYTIHYGWIPPVGSIIRVRFVDTQTAAKEDLGDADAAGGTYGSRSGALPGGHSAHRVGH